MMTSENIEEVPSYLTELWAQFKLAWPLAISFLLLYLLEPTSIAFCGHLGKLELASVSTAISIIYIIVVSTGRGLAFGGETFFSQTYGSEHRKNVGVYLQKGIVFCVMWSMPLIGLLLNAEPILLLLKQDPDVARHVQIFLDVFMPGVLGYYLLFLMMRFLACQNQVIPIAVIYVLNSGVNALLNYTLVYVAGLGIRGSAMALMMSYWIGFFMMIFYLWCRNIYEETWGGWSLKCLEEWGEFAALTTSSIAMTILFWLFTVAGTYLCGLISPLALSVFSISFQIEGTTWMIPAGLRDGCAIRIGQFLGADKPKSAHNSAKVAFTAIVIVSIILGAVVFGCRYLLPLVFTSNKEIVDKSASVISFTALYIAIDGFENVGVGVIRATGRQFFGMILSIINMIVSLPIAIPLLFKTELGIKGLWLGYICGMLVANVVVIIFVVTLNWKEEAEKAGERSKVGYSTSTDSEELTENIELVTSSTTKLYDEDLLKSKEETQGIISYRNLILKRLATFLCFFMLLSAGILSRLFVNVNSSSTVTVFCAECNNATTSTNVQETTVFSIY